MMHSFLLIGQSNMAGRGRIQEAVPLDKKNISVLRNGRWRAMYRPVNPDRVTAGVCLAESFAEAYVKSHQVKVGLIPCADGGTRLDQWLPGTRLFDNAVFQAKLAIRSSNLAGILWHQGESDAIEDRYLVHADKLQLILNAMRRELEAYDVPVLLGGIGDFLSGYENNSHHQWPQINEAIQQVADRDPMYGFVSAQGLGHNGDSLHFNAEALHEFGLRYYREFEKLERKDKCFVEKEDPDAAIRTALEEL